MMPFPEINPIAFEIGPLAVRWYGLAYITAFIAGSWYMKRLTAAHPAKNMTPQTVENFFVWAILGVILGGRLGYVLFYNLDFFLQNPGAILRTWEGGMSFHGGAAGVIIAMLVFSRIKRIHPADLADRLVPAVPIGLLLGRLANYINGELWGRVTSPEFPLATIFPADPLQLPRHPSQLYEAALEGLVLGLILWAITRTGIRRWLPSGVFLLGYGLARFMVEFVREPDPQFLNAGGIYTVLSQGQILCLPMIAAGAAMILWAYRTPATGRPTVSKPQR